MSQREIERERGERAGEGWSGDYPEPAPEGGVMGLSTAARLAERGYRVVVLDENHPIRGTQVTRRLMKKHFGDCFPPTCTRLP